MSAPHILLVGCGQMGAALLGAWQNNSPKQFAFCSVIDPSSTKRESHPKIHYYRTLDALPKSAKPEVVIFAVKPQQLEGVMPAYRERFGTSPLYISIAAGKEIAFFETHLGKKARIIRAMPNTPARIGMGVTALCYSSGVSASDKRIAASLFDAVGGTLWVEESQMDVVTALSGSGPAYVFLFLESLIDAATAHGLDSATAKALSLHTLIGSCALAGSSQTPLSELRAQVTSPGGTTQAALDVLMQNKALSSLFAQAISRAISRAKELKTPK